MAEEEEDTCSPYVNTYGNLSAICLYVQENADLCEGGGYIRWTELKVCSDSPAIQLLVVFLSLLFFVYLFVLLTTTADDFFCANIACIIDHHKISQNIAGITIMAFGNGAPDIFSSIASVISVPNPKAGLAISELLGGGIFVTTIVISLIILARPFDMIRRPVIRDILFYLLALGLLIFVVVYDTEIHIWQPCIFLAVYLVYAFIVISGGMVRQRIRRQNRKSRLMTRAILAASKIVPRKCASTPNLTAAAAAGKGRGAKVAPIATIQPCVIVDKKELGKKLEWEGDDHSSSTNRDGHREFIITPATLERGSKGVESTTSLPTFNGKLVIPIGNEINGKDNDSDEYLYANDYLEAGKFFVKEELDNEEDSETTTSSLMVLGENKDKVIVAAASDIGREMRVPSDCSSTAFADRTHSKQRRMLVKFGKHLSPLDVEEYHRAKWYLKIYHLFKVPCMIFLKVSVPLGSVAWYKPLVILHAFIVPLVFCAAFQILEKPLIPGGSAFTSVWALALLVSIILTLLVLFLTRSDVEPKYYKQIASYVGFAMSIAWIYASASEVVNIVLMFGNLFGIAYQILGLTAVSWCNSIGDCVADFSVARQGFPRMAFSAAIGGPLFNLLVGFGSTFIIAKLQGKRVSVEVDGVKIAMFATLAISLTSTLVLLFVQRFKLGRGHGVYLIMLYLVFLVVAVVVCAKVI